MTKHNLTGYHATTKRCAEKILSSGEFHDSTKENEWLGRGVYFFYYRNDADWWSGVGRLKRSNTQILRGLLEYSDEQLVDLDDSEELQKCLFYVREFLRLQRERGIPVSAKIEDPCERKCFFCNTIRKAVPQIGIIIHTFPASPSEEVKDSFEETGFWINRKQICVSNHSIITGIEGE